MNNLANKILKTAITVATGFIPVAAFPCTSAIIGASANPSGRPILWKHRDTSNTDNKVEYVAASSEGYAYTALFNASDTALREAWMGMNEAGFAVMNTASYNIKDDKVPDSAMDKEGIVMTKALRSCRTVDDFARLLETLPRPMGVEANFGVIDAEGNGAYFETNNHAYVRFDLKDAPGDVIVRTNYSHSGRPGEGYGHVREANAEHLLQPYIETRSVTPELLTETISRTFYHDGHKRNFDLGEQRIVADEDFIPRYKSTATVAIEGCRPIAAGDTATVTPGFVADEYIMWTGLGYPPAAETRVAKCAPGGVDNELRGILPNGHSPLADKAKAVRDKAFTVRKGKKPNLIDLEVLYNKEGTGYTQETVRKNLETYRNAKKQRDGGTAD